MFLYFPFCLTGQSIGLGFTWSHNVSTHTFSQLYNYSDNGIDETFFFKIIYYNILWDRVLHKLVFSFNSIPLDFGSINYLKR